jgi:hypothetical protein
LTSCTFQCPIFILLKEIRAFQNTRFFFFFSINFTFASNTTKYYLNIEEGNPFEEINERKFRALMTGKRTIIEIRAKAVKKLSLQHGLMTAKNMVLF